MKQPCSARTQYLRIGSTLCSVNSQPEHYAEVLAEVYGTRLFEREEGGLIGLSIRIDECPSRKLGDSDRLRVNAVEGGYMLDTDPLSCRLILDAHPPRSEIMVKQPAMSAAQLAYHFLILTNRMLLLLDRLLLHAAAIEFEDRVNLFSGHKGAGKSTVSIALAQAGGTVLAEDHTILSRRDSRYFVSGCTSRMRVTAATERQLLRDQLHCEPVDVGGMPKKEFSAENFFESRPHEERRPDQLFLTRVGKELKVRPVRAREALLWMVDKTRDTFRFAKNDDYASFLQLLAGFVGSVSTYALDLSPNLSEVRRLPELLRSLPGPVAQ